MIKTTMSISTLVAVTSLAVVNAVLFTSALPSISEAFKIDSSMAQQLISVFLLGYAITQIAFGPISNAYGRRKSLRIGLSIGFAGTLMCIGAIYLSSYNLMYYGRFISGFGIASGLVIGFTMINDVYGLKRARKVTGLCVISFALAPGVSTFIGSLLTSYFSWKSCFYFLLVLNAAVIFFAFKLPDTLRNSKRKSLSPEVIILSYYKAFTNRKVTVTGFVIATSIGALYSTITLLPFVAVNMLQMSTFSFGIAFLLSYLGYALGSVITTTTAHKIDAVNSIRIGLFISLAGGIIFMLLAMSGYLTAWALFPAVFVIFCGVPFVLTNGTAFGISSHIDKASASSVITFIFMIITFAAVNYIGLIKIRISYLIPITVILLSVIGLVLQRLICSVKNHQM